MSDTFTNFTEGDLVLSVYGDGASADGGNGPTAPYGDNQASPIVLDEVTTAGVAVASLALPQTTAVDADGVTENAISGEYGSSSEGALALAADGRSLVIGGYGVNAATFNTGGASIYGNAALAQSTSVPGGPYTVVPRVVADIAANGSVDTSTALNDVFNTNNIRSVATVDGRTFYVSGQGVKGDTTQGVFVATDGASSATAIDTSTDTRMVAIVNGQLDVSRDSKQGTGGTANIADYGTTLPTGATAPTVLPGISQTVTLTTATENGVNDADTGEAVHLSPEAYFFASATTLYVADSGNPKEGGLGDGGLQKWSFNGTRWALDYTLSAGLGLVADTATAGTTGLIGLTGKVVGDTVELYATNSTIGDEDPTYLFGINDALDATTAPTGERFTALVTAAPDTNIRGVAFAPTAPCFAAGTRLATARGPVPVEALAIGDVMRLADGGTAPVIWLGHRRVRLDAHPVPDAVRPVRIRANAFGDGLPVRDLVLSPDHAIRHGGALIPVHLLVDDALIVRDDVAAVTYHHVELDRHDVLLAENLPVESYRDTGNRRQFANASLVSLHTSFGPGPDPVPSCAPLALDGPAVEAARAQLARLARAAAVSPLPSGSGAVPPEAAPADGYDAPASRAGRG